MRIAYVTHTRFPTEKAHGHQIAQVCQALHRLGNDVTLLHTSVGNTITRTAFDYYGMKEEFSVVRLPHFDALGSRLVPEIASFAMNMWLYRRALSRYMRLHSFDLFYCRSTEVLSPLLATGMPVALELHSLPRTRLGAFVRACNRCTLVVCLTSPLRDQLLALGVQKERICVEGDAVDLERFARLPAMDAAKTSWSLPEDTTVVGYVGRLKTLGKEKGVGDLLHALALLKADGVSVTGFVVGGPEADTTAYRTMAKDLGLSGDDIRFTGDIASTDVPRALAACDILAMPFPDFPHYRNNMSPLKMFEYMAAGKPIVTSDLPTVRDVLSEKTAFFCTPGSPASIKDALSYILNHPQEAQERAQAARTLVEQHTWEKRMARILRIMDN